MVAEVLPGATRFSSLFVLPIEMCVWGGGALLIRAAVRRWRLGWRSMVCLALALAIAEECLIQQTSLAPLVIQLKGVVYARAFGINYVYLLWALIYESVFVVVVPIHLVELIFPDRRSAVWLTRIGLAVTGFLFSVGSFLAWFTWTQIARVKVFHLPPYTPPMSAVLTAVAAIAALMLLASRPAQNVTAGAPPAWSPPSPWLLGIAGALWAVLWYGLVLLGFGIAPWIPPAYAVTGGLALVAGILLTLPRWCASPRWSDMHTYGVVCGTMVGSMLVGFVGFVGAAPLDLYFKIAVNVIAMALLARLGATVAGRGVSAH